MISLARADNRYLDCFRRNGDLASNIAFRNALTKLKNQSVDSSSISILQEFNLSIEDTFVVVDFLRVPVFRLWKVPISPGFLRVYLYQALTSEFAISESLMQEFKYLEKSFNELSQNEIINLLENNGLFDQENPETYFYYFYDELHMPIEFGEGFEEYIRSFACDGFDFFLSSHGLDFEDSDEIDQYEFHYGQFPTLFTGICSVSFDRGGAIVLERFFLQIYDLYTANGFHVQGPCHDIEQLANGKYYYRSCPGFGDNSGRFRLEQFYFDSTILNGNYWQYDNPQKTTISNDCSSDLGDCLNGNCWLHEDPKLVTNEIQSSSDLGDCLFVNGRDVIELEPLTCDIKRVENFDRPYSIEDAISILRNDSSNHITSPELSFFYQNNKEAAMLAVKRNPVSYSLLCQELREDRDVRELFSNC
jgi:hypothetical protein